MLKYSASSSNLPAMVTLVLSALASLSSPAAARSGASQVLRVLYASDRQAELDPCDCPGTKLGGIEEFVNAVRAQTLSKDRGHTLLVDSGDLFFALPQIAAADTKAALVKAQVVGHAYSDLGKMYLTPGERDLALGKQVFEELLKLGSVRPLSCNLFGADKKRLFDCTAVEHAGTHTIGVVGISGVEAFSLLHDSRLRVTDELTALKEAMAELRTKHVNRAIVLAHAGPVLNRKLSDVPGVIAVFGAHTADVLAQPERLPTQVVAQASIQGQELGVVDWDFQTNRWTTHRTVQIDRSFKKPNKATRLLAKWKGDQKSSALAQTAAKSADTKQGHRFVGNPYKCKACHLEQFNFWQKTHHASAYLVLYAKDQAYDPDCIQCHTLGYQSAAGFSARAGSVVLDNSFRSKDGPFVEALMKATFAKDSGKGPLDSRLEAARYAELKAQYHSEVDKLESSKKLTNLYLGVQCEHCHGNRSGHPTRAVAKTRIEPSLCKQCHDSIHNPSFNYTAMRPQIACPLIAKKKL